MNAKQLLAHFDRLAEAPNAVPRLRRFILDLAVQGKLMERSTNWSRVTLEDLGKWGSGGTPLKTHNEYYGGDIPWLVIGDLNDAVVTKAETYITQAGLENSSTKLVDVGTVLIAMYGSIGKLGIAGIRCATNQAIAHCAVDVGIVERDYLVVLLKSMRAALLAKGQGVAQQNISQKILKSHAAMLPPLAEQRRIVAKVDELMALCDQLEAAQQERERRRDRLAAASLQRLNQPAIDATPVTQREHARFHLNHLQRLIVRPEHIKAMRQTFFNLAVCGKLVDQELDAEPAAKLLKRLGVNVVKSRSDNNFHTIPPTWTWVTVDEIANVSSGTTPSRDVAEYYSSNGTPWVTSGETSNALITATAQHVTSKALKETSLKLYPPGTLIVAMYGQGKTRGQIAELCIAATTNQACAAIVLKLEDQGHRRYVKLFFQKIYEQIRELAAGGAQPNLNGGKIKSTLIPLPPLAEQHRIVAKVDALMALCDQLEAQLTTTQTDSRRLLEAVLEAALAPV